VTTARLTGRMKRAILTAGALAGALVAVAGLVAAPVRVMDARYVLRADQARRGAIDSLNYARDMKEVRAALARVDTNVLCLRHPDREFCQ
jgi:hypothetical protein